jgi:hypothetical protein
VSAEFVNDAVKGLTEAEVERAILRLNPQSDQEQAMAARAARFGGAEAPAGGAVAPAAVPFDELAAAKRRARFGAIADEPKLHQQSKQQQQQQQKAKHGAQNGGSGKKQEAKKDQRDQKKKERDVATEALFKAPEDDATKAALAARAARFGGASAATTN